MSEKESKNFFYKVEKSALLTIIGVLFLFSGAVIVTLIAPSLVDPTWTEPISKYQVQMYEVADPSIFISSTQKSGADLQFVYHISEGTNLLAFKESNTVRFVSPPELKEYITTEKDPVLKLTSKLLLLRQPQENSESDFNAYKVSESLRKELQAVWEKEKSEGKHQDELKPDFTIYELFSPGAFEAFALAPTDAQTENWIDHNFKILDPERMQPWHGDRGVIYIPNPQEYRISRFTTFTGEEGWRYDPNGEPITNLTELRGHDLGFRSRKELIADGEHIYAIEGCWYCHTDQTRTLIQDVVLNGSDSFPAPPSSANEYIYQKVTFPGTRRIGPDLSRVGVKRPSRDWHKGHFWSPKTASKGSIMPAFQHFFDYDPRGSAKNVTGVPNYRFEAVFQYLMTKGTRITPPTEAWWLGLDPIDTKAIIEGKKTLP
jgi:cytochrome c oxidase cbb3-type subunit 2